jgi:hypothetical protein
LDAEPDPGTGKLMPIHEEPGSATLFITDFENLKNGPFRRQEFRESPAFVPFIGKFSQLPQIIAANRAELGESFFPFCSEFAKTKRNYFIFIANFQ